MIEYAEQVSIFDNKEISFIRRETVCPESRR
jgi:hypothetical protein